MTIDSLDGTRGRRFLRGLRGGDPNEQVALALGEAEELFGKLVDAAEAGRIDSETYTALQGEFDLMRAQEDARSPTDATAAAAMLSRVQRWKRDVRQALGIGTAMIAVGLVGTALVIGGAAVWWSRRKKRR